MSVGGSRREEGGALVEDNTLVLSREFYECGLLSYLP